MSHVVETMSSLKLGFDVPDTRPVQGAKVERLAIQGYLQYDKNSKRYVPVTPKTMYKGRHRGKKPTTFTPSGAKLASPNPSQQAIEKGYLQEQKRNRSPKAPRQDFLSKVKAKNLAIAASASQFAH